MDVSKTKTSFYRRLYVAWLIDSGQASNIPEIMAVTGMPRRTAQDTLLALPDLGIQCEFKQTSGARNNAGHYHIQDWGPINPVWIEQHLTTIRQTLGYL